MEAVILVHGHAAHPILMAPLRRRLRANGYHALTWGYQSLRGSILEHAAALTSFVDSVDLNPEITKVHFVGHSMGAILIRTSLRERKPKKLGRVVLLAPPNRGARLADFARRFLGLRLKATDELGSHPESLVNQLPADPSLDLGIIAAAYDHVVAQSSTRLDGARDYLVVKSSHTLPLHHRVPHYVLNYLKAGRFEI